MDKMERMATLYHEHSGAQVYALGFPYAHSLYVAKLTFEQLSAYFKLDRASSKRGGFLKLRIRMKAAQRKALAEIAELVGDWDELIEIKDGWNRGEHFERVLTERWTGERWTKDSVRFDQCGDIRVDGVEIQIKLDGAELTNEKVLAGL